MKFFSQKHLLIVIVFVLLFAFNISSVEAAKAPSTSPITACSALDSLDFSTHVANQIDNRLQGKSPVNALTAYIPPTKSLQPLTTVNRLNWTRNQYAWTQAGAKPLDFTGVAAFNDAAGSLQYTRGVTMISPRHFVVAEHYPVYAGNTVGFIDAQGKQVSKKVVKTTPVAFDIMVGVLDSDVPDSIAYYPILNSDLQKKLFEKRVYSAYTVPVVMFDQEGKVLVSELITSGVTNVSAQYTFPRTSPRKEFNESIIVGDSGQPEFIIADNQPILISTLHTGGAGTGPNLGRFIPEINRAMASLGGGYQITQYNPSCFTQSSVSNTPYFTAAESTVKNIKVSEWYTSNTTVIGWYTAAIQNTSGVTFSYSLSSTDFPNVNEYFGINGLGGLVYKKAMDYETMPHQIQIKVQAQPSNGMPAISRESTITIANTNDSPVFTSNQFTFTAISGAVAGTKIGDITAYDPDTKGVIGASSVLTYKITTSAQSFFRINEQTGEIFANQPIPSVTVPTDYIIPVQVDSVDSLSLVDTIVPLPSNLSAAMYSLWNKPNSAAATVKITVNPRPVVIPNPPMPLTEIPSTPDISTSTSTTDTSATTTPLRRRTTLVEIKATSTKPLSKMPEGVKSLEISNYVLALNANTNSSQLPLFSKTFKQGDSSIEVMFMQMYLNDKGFLVSDFGPGSYEQETMYFGPKSKQALIKFQKSVGITPAVGIYGPITQSYMEMNP